MSIISMGHFTAIGMRVSVKDPAALIINTCGYGSVLHYSTVGQKHTLTKSLGSGTMLSMEKQKVLRDGRGKPIDEKAHYYIQDTRQTVGNCALFWRPDGAGYTCDLLDAGVYPGTHAKGRRDTDVYWPVEAVRKQMIVHVRVERLRDMAPKRRVRKAK